MSILNIVYVYMCLRIEILDNKFLRKSLHEFNSFLLKVIEDISQMTKQYWGIECKIGRPVDNLSREFHVNRADWYNDLLYPMQFHMCVVINHFSYLKKKVCHLY